MIQCQKQIAHESDKAAHLQLFDGLDKLVSLNLSSNKIEFLSASNFAKLTNLRKLTLASNRIHEISANAFEGLARLAELDLSDNPVFSVSPLAFDGLATLEHLHLFVRTHTRRIQKDVSPLSSPYGKHLLDALQLVDELKIEESLFARALTHQRQQSPLVTLKSVESQLQFRCSEPTGSLYDWRNLTALTMTNSFIRHLHADHFDARLPNLSVLDLSSNKLTKLSNRLFVSLPCLTKLVLFNNLIEEIDVHAFDGLGRLSRLDLSRNQLEQLHDGVFAELSGLEDLILSKNNFHSFDSTRLFDGLGKLRTLKIDYCESLLHIQSGLFDSLGDSLETLNMECLSAQCTYQADVFKRLGRLKLLLMDDDVSRELDARMFAGLVELDELQIRGRRIETLAADAFNDLHKLKTLRLNCPNVKRLDISKEPFNRLESLNTLVYNKNTKLANHVRFDYTHPFLEISACVYSK